MFIDHSYSWNPLPGMSLPEEGLSPRQREELHFLKKERDPEMYLAGMLAFAGRLEQAGKPEFAAEVYSALVDIGAKAPPYGSPVARAFRPGGFSPAVPNPAVLTKANQRLAALQGSGNFGTTAELLIGNFAETATDYRIILPMIAASSLFQITKTAALGRIAHSARATWWTRGVGARATSSLLATTVEIPAFTLMSRGLRDLSGQPVSWNEAAVTRDLLGAGITLGALKLSALAGQGASSLVARRPYLLTTGDQRLVTFLAPPAAMFAGILGAHQLEQAAGLRPHVDGATTFTDTLATWLSLAVGARLGAGIIRPRETVMPRESRMDGPFRREWGREQVPLGPRHFPEKPPENPLPQPMMMAAKGTGRGASLDNRQRQMRDMDRRVKTLVRSIEAGDLSALTQLAQELGTNLNRTQENYHWSRFRKGSPWKKIPQLNLSALQTKANEAKVRNFLSFMEGLGNPTAYYALYAYAVPRAEHEPEGIFILEGLQRSDRPEVITVMSRLEVGRLLDGARGPRRDSHVLALQILARHRNPAALSALHRLAVEDPNAFLMLRALGEEGYPAAQESLKTLEPKFLLSQAFDSENKTALLALGLLARAKNIHILPSLVAGIRKNPRWMERLFQWNQKNFEGASFLVQGLETLSLGEYLRLHPASMAKDILEDKAKAGDAEAARILAEWEHTGRLPPVEPVLPGDPTGPVLRGVKIVRFPPRSQVPFFSGETQYSWVLLKGEVEVNVTGEVSKILESGAFSPTQDPRWGRQWMVITRVPSLFLQHDPKNPEEWKEEAPMADFFPSPLRMEEWKKKVMEAFPDLSRNFIDRVLWRGGKVFRYLPGETVARQADPAEYLFFVLEGGLRSYPLKGFRETRMVGPGGLSGEISLLSGKLNPRVLQAEQPSIVLRIPAAALRLFPELHRYFRFLAKPKGI